MDLRKPLTKIHIRSSRNLFPVAVEVQEITWIEPSQVEGDYLVLTRDGRVGHATIPDLARVLFTREEVA